MNYFASCLVEIYWVTTWVELLKTTQSVFILLDTDKIKR